MTTMSEKYRLSTPDARLDVFRTKVRNSLKYPNFLYMSWLPQNRLSALERH